MTILLLKGDCAAIPDGSISLDSCSSCSWKTSENLDLLGNDMLLPFPILPPLPFKKRQYSKRVSCCSLLEGGLGGGYLAVVQNM